MSINYQSLLGVSDVTTDNITTNNITATNINSTNITSANINSTNLTTTNATCSSLTSSSISSSNITASTSISCPIITSTNLTTTNATCSSLTSTNINSTNLTTGQVILGNESIGSSSTALLFNVNGTDTFNWYQNGINVMKLTGTALSINKLATISGYLQVNQTLVPNTNSNFDLGTTTLRWRSLYANTVDSNSLILDSSTSSASGYIYLNTNSSTVTGLNWTATNGFTIYDQYNSDYLLYQGGLTKNAIRTKNNILDDGSGNLTVSGKMYLYNTNYNLTANNATNTLIYTSPTFHNWLSGSTKTMILDNLGNLSMQGNTTATSGSLILQTSDSNQKSSYDWNNSSGISIYDNYNSSNWLTQGGTTVGKVMTKNNTLDDGTGNVAITGYTLNIYNNNYGISTNDIITTQYYNSAGTHSFNSSGNVMMTVDNSGNLSMTGLTNTQTGTISFKTSDKQMRFFLKWDTTNGIQIQDVNGKIFICQNGTTTGSIKTYSGNILEDGSSNATINGILNVNTIAAPSNTLNLKTNGVIGLGINASQTVTTKNNTLDDGTGNATTTGILNVNTIAAPSNTLNLKTNGIIGLGINATQAVTTKNNTLDDGSGNMSCIGTMSCANLNVSGSTSFPSLPYLEATGTSNLATDSFLSFNTPTINTFGSQISLTQILHSGPPTYAGLTANTTIKLLINQSIQQVGSGGYVAVGCYLNRMLSGSGTWVRIGGNITQNSGVSTTRPSYCIPVLLQANDTLEFDFQLWSGSATSTNYLFISQIL